MRTEDGSIIQQCLSGDPSAFGMLVDKYKAGIYAFVYDKLRNFQDAQDVTQKVFVKAYLSLRRLRNWESFTFWLYRIARNLCKDWIRDQSRRPDREFIEDQDPEILKVYSLNLYRENQMYEPLQEALDSLPDSYREALLLHYFGGMTIKDMARSLGASPTAIGMRLNRARAHLREEMVTTMESAFRGQKLQSTFTFRVVEAVKRIRIPPMPRVAGLSWGLSAAAGIIMVVLSLNPQMSILSDMTIPAGSPIPAEMKVLKAGEITVDILKASEISAISSKQGGGDGREPRFPNPQKAALMVAPGEEDTWTEKAGMPTPRRALSTCAVNGRIYAIGGIDPGWQVLPTVEEYDPKIDKWERKADMPSPGFALSISAVNGKIYAIGGGWRASTVEEYDPKTNEWEEKSDMPTERQNLSTGVVDGRIYAIGGVDGTNTVFFPTVEEYDPKTDTWEKKSTMPTARAALSISVVNGKVYAIGGCDLVAALSTVEEYDPKTDAWENKAEMPTARFGLATSVVNGKIYAIGGEGAVPNVGVPTVEIYDPAIDSWTKGPDMPTARRGLSASAVNEDIYVIGGATLPNTALSITEKCDTRFVGQAIWAKGKLVKPWGGIKSN